MSKVSIAPWLSVEDATKALDFYKRAFNAKELERLESEPGTIEAAGFWIQRDNESHPRALGGKSPVRMILSVPEPDASFVQALKAGAKQISPISEGCGWRVGRIEDPFGHHWEIGRPLK